MFVVVSLWACGNDTVGLPGDDEDPDDTPDTATTLCGDGVVEGSEQCDGGTCCAADCTFAEAGTDCADATPGDCNDARCDGAGACDQSYSAEADGYICRASAESCDPAETCGGTAGECPADVSSCVKTFKVYSAGKCYNELSMASLGILRNTLVTQSAFFSASYPTSGPVDPVKTQNLFEDLRDDGRPIVFDIESWDMPEGWADGSASAVEIEAHRQLYIDVIDIFRSDPSLVIGFYGEMPIRNYLQPVRYFNNPTNESYELAYLRWLTNNDFYIPVAAKVDVLYPSLYTFSNYLDPDDWEVYALENIREAYRISDNKKQVIAYVWPRLHGNAAEFVPADLWRRELEIIRANADGVVIWNISTDDCGEIGASALWQETVEFLEGLAQTP